MYWSHQASVLTRHGLLKRFGLITTNSISQTFNRRVIESALADVNHPLSLTFAIPDHPWVDAVDGAAVRVAMTVGATGIPNGQMRIVESEASGKDDEVLIDLRGISGVIHADLTVGADLASSRTLRSNSRLCSPGLKLHGSGFIVTPDRSRELGLGSIARLESFIRPYLNGNDIVGKPRNLLVIDLFGMSADETRTRFPATYQHVLEHVKPERDAKSHTTDGAGYARLWWLHGKPRQELRTALVGLPKYIATPETAKHRLSQFLDAEIAPDNMLVCIAISDALILGMLSSLVHVVWALSAGGRLGVGNDPRYNKTRCFDPFPFPSQNHRSAGEIRALAEQLDAHRKRRQAAHPDLTLTGMYNVLEKLRSGDVLTSKERVIHEHGLVSVLRQLHDEIDAAVLDAYGWSDLLPLLRIAHGSDPVSPLPPGEGAPRGAGEGSGSRDAETWGKNQANASTGPSSDASRHLLPEGEGRSQARRAFDDAILERLVALNAERAAEEARGIVRWLRPEFQDPSAQPSPQQSEIDTGSDDDTSAVIAATSIKPKPWPNNTVEQVRAGADVLAASPIALSIEDIAQRFTARGAWKKRLPSLLAMLITLGRAREHEGRYAST